MATHRRATAAVLVTLVCALAATGCTTAPAPTASPTSTGFASDDAAFAAAEATFRSYITASNEVHPEDASTFEDFLSLSTGEQHAFDQERLEKYHADGYKLTGATRIVKVNLDSFNPDQRLIALNVCLDVSQVEILDSSGTSVVSHDRPDQQNLSVRLTTDPMRVLLIEGSNGADACSN
ncbi:hypothetical protein ITJ43_02880 [Microbacterium sp. VKM Ac-2870]|uniref:hypothetical protein n=1 Tax=Microbacterium sp. VKM Ac-2870 TaxID=2783825 RepID=UPI00188C33E8|nr:hypothetical protein [Microbacterium sp. VKM Ac-2870]MBF4561072.1 hypothetical protein [Microbacterium sp. VKM Ac-2870]